MRVCLSVMVCVCVCVCVWVWGEGGGDVEDTFRIFIESPGGFMSVQILVEGLSIHYSVLQSKRNLLRFPFSKLASEVTALLKCVCPFWGFPSSVKAAVLHFPCALTPSSVAEQVQCGASVGSFPILHIKFNSILFNFFYIAQNNTD